MAWALGVVVGAVALVSVGLYGAYLGVNYAYRWNAACVAAGGQKLESASGNKICVREPVVMVPIAAKPW